jgi:hypothetical protein
MTKKIAKYELPRVEAVLDALARSVLTYVGPHIEDGSWTDIPAASWAAFKAAYAMWAPAYAACKEPHLPTDTEAKNLAEVDLRLALSDLLDRGLLLSPRTADDAVAMGFTLIDDARTGTAVVTDSVDMSITNDPQPDSHTHIIHYRKLGAPNRSKAPWHLAVFQTYIQGPGDPEPLADDDSFWSADITNMKSPYTHQHLSTDIGKTCWYRTRWQAKNGNKGPWTMKKAGV